MPTYEYECKGCGHALEISQPMTEAPKRSCPKCGARKLVRRIGGGGGIIFKGAGFYATDYRKGSPPKDSTDKPSSSSDSSCKPTGCDKPECPQPKKSDAA